MILVCGSASSCILFKKSACPRISLVYWNNYPRKPIGIKHDLEIRYKTTVRNERCSLVRPMAEFLSDSTHHGTSQKIFHGRKISEKFYDFRND